MTRLRSQAGFGMLEMLISLVMLNVGVLALVAAFNSGSLAIQRASRTGTASTLADTQMELYRALDYSAIALDSANVTTANGDSTYAGDVAYSGTQVTTTCTGSPSSVPTACKPMQTPLGPDHVSYRIHSYIKYVTPTNGRQIKKVTVVVRLTTSSRVLARLSSYFDQSTGR